MSYDIYLKDPVSGDILYSDEKLDIKGGTYALGGTNELWINITYNYSEHFYRVLKGGIRSIYGMTGEESLPKLKMAVEQLKDNVSSNYWEPTEGNARKALLNLIKLAEIRPDGVWSGD